MHGFLTHLRISLILNCRNLQALIFGYVVPVFFLIALGSVFGGPNGLTAASMGQVLAISTLGGACFGMPITMVGERERGVWRRYRLTPLGTGWFILSTMLARFAIVASAAVLQYALAMAAYKLPLPAHPLDLAMSFTLVSFAFIGIGLIIATVATSIGAVQALGQTLFLPMIIIGGVGIPVWNLPAWIQPVSLYLPGRYAVNALANSIAPAGAFKAPYCLAALVVIGAAATVVGWKLFRWEPGQRLARSAPLWILLAVGTWLVIGAVAHANPAFVPAH
jgi:ABC-2 type transport system permease protein